MFIFLLFDTWLAIYDRYEVTQVCPSVEKGYKNMY